MPRKNKGQRKSKGQNGEDSTNTTEIDLLPEDHTIAESLSTLQSYQEEFMNDEDEDNDVDLTQTAVRHAKLVDALELAEDNLNEKRTVKREQHLRALFKAITQYSSSFISKELVESKLDSTIIPVCLHSFRSTSSPVEKYASCRCIEATAIIIGYNNDDYVESVDAPLRKLVKATGLAVQVRGAALRSLSMALFICGSGADSSEVGNLMDFCEAVAAERFRGQTVDASLRATALECWTLLGTCLSDSDLAGVDDFSGNRACVTMLPLFQKCLEEADSSPSHMHLKSACGECVALIHEARLDLGAEGEDVEELNTTQRRYQKGTWEGSDYEVIIDEIKQCVSDLSVTTGHHMSKKNKKEQRATFREIQHTLVDDERPCETISIGNTDLELTSWRAIVQLRFIRHCLQGGFQAQFMSNETLWEIFGVRGHSAVSGSGIGNSERMSQLEKRLLMSKTSDASKAADLDLTKRRTKRNKAKNLFFTADGEDI